MGHIITLVFCGSCSLRTVVICFRFILATASRGRTAIVRLLVGAKEAFHTLDLCELWILLYQKVKMSDQVGDVVRLEVHSSQCLFCGLPD